MTGRWQRKWDQRLERARELAAAQPFAAEGLRFYERIASFQKSLYANFAAGSGPAQEIRPPGALRDGLELALLLRWGEVLAELWRSGGPDAAALAPAEALLAWAFLQPYAEHLADHTERVERAAAPAAPPLCPLCSGRPLAGVLRQQGDGGRRSLICSLCATEWDHRRLVCPGCGEERADKLPVYIAEQLPHVRVEACDTCRSYLKTIDLTKDGRAVPVVDELAALPLSLWAEENRYTKVIPNLLGL